MTDPTARDGRHGDVLAVVSQSGPTVTFFDAATDVVLGALELLAEPHELCFDPTQRLLWCTNTYYSGYYGANAGPRTQLTVIDPDSRRIVEVVDIAPEHGPHGLALDAARGRLYVSVEGSDERSGGVVVIDTATRKALGRIDTGAPGPHWFVIDPAGERGYASNKEAPFVSIIDLAAGILTATVEVPGSEGLAVSADGSELYVAAPDVGSVKSGGTGPRTPTGIRVIDTKAATVVDVLPIDAVAFPVCLTSTGTLLTAGIRQGPSTLTAFSTATRKQIADVQLAGERPLTITASPDGRLGYVAAIRTSTVDIVDLQHWTVLNSLKVAKRGEPGAHGLAYISARE
jgi:DNA-binding beta-propeller fold protein YncE